MRRFLDLPLLACVLALTAGGASTTAPRRAPASPPAAGQAVPDFALPDQNGATVHLAAERGKKVVLVFYRGYW